MTIYCMGPDKLATQLWSELRIRETPEKCAEYLNKFFETYPGVKQYLDNTKAFASRYNFVTTYTGRRRRFEIAKFDRAAISKMCRQACNSIIQTSSSDTVLSNLLDLNDFLKQNNLGRVIGAVHDSVVMCIKKGTSGLANAFYKIVTEKTAERCPWLPINWVFDVEKGSSYGEAHEEVV